MKIICLPAICYLLFLSCATPTGTSNLAIGESSKTGVPYNEPIFGNFSVLENYVNPVGPGLTFIKGGSANLGGITDDVMYQWNNRPRKVTVTSFYMDITEVANVDWREYVHWLKSSYEDDQFWKGAMPDETVWRSNLGFNEPIVKYYYSHPTYNYYPVVGVTWEQANAYCLWRTDRVNEMYLIQQRVIDPDTTKKNEDVFTVEGFQFDPETYPLNEKVAAGVRNNIPMIAEYRLPTEAEWEFAAMGNIPQEENLQQRNPYPWNSPGLRQPEGLATGQFNANFKRGIGDYAGLAYSNNDRYTITAPVNSFTPNDYGLYNMAGNVNEWVFDVYRQTLEQQDDIAPVRGNIFAGYDVDDLGNKIKNQTGHYEKRVEQDVRNYLDGDNLTSISTQDDWKGAAEDPFKFERPVLSLMNDSARTYKGGSWKDMPFWLSPATRRFLDQKMSTNDIGFRCAMIALTGDI